MKKFFFSVQPSFNVPDIILNPCENPAYFNNFYFKSNEGVLSKKVCVFKQAAENMGINIKIILWNSLKYLHKTPRCLSAQKI